MGLSLSLRLSHHHAVYIINTGYLGIHSGTEGAQGWTDSLPQLHVWEVHHLRGGVTEGDDEVHGAVQADRLQGDEDDMPEVLCGQQRPLQVQERGHLHREEQGTQT